MSEAYDDLAPIETLSTEALARRAFLLKLFLPVATLGVAMTSSQPAEAQSLLRAIINNIQFPVPYRRGGYRRGYGSRRIARAPRRHHVASGSRNSGSKSSSRAEPKLLD